MDSGCEYSLLEDILPEPDTRPHAEEAPLDHGNPLERANVLFVPSNEGQGFSRAREAQELPDGIPFTTLIKRQFAALCMNLLSAAQENIAPIEAKEEDQKESDNEDSMNSLPRTETNDAVARLTDQAELFRKRAEQLTFQAQRLAIKQKRTAAREKKAAMHAALTGRYTVKIKKPISAFHNNEVDSLHDLGNHKLSTFMRDLPLQISAFKAWDHTTDKKPSCTQKISAPLHGLNTLFMACAGLTCFSLTPTLLETLPKDDPIQNNIILTAHHGLLALLSPIPLPLRMKTWPSNALVHLAGASYIIASLALNKYLLKKYQGIMQYQNTIPYKQTHGILRGLMQVYFILRAAPKIAAMNMAITALQAIHRIIKFDARVTLVAVILFFILCSSIMLPLYFQHVLSGYYPLAPILVSLLLASTFIDIGLSTETTQALLYYGQWGLGAVISLTTLAHQHKLHYQKETNDQPNINKAVLLKSGISMLMQTVYHSITTAFISIAMYQALIGQNNAKCQTANAAWWGFSITAALGSAAYVYATRASFAPVNDETNDDESEYDLLFDDVHSESDIDEQEPLPTHHRSSRKTIIYSFLKWGLAISILSLYGGFDFHAAHNPFKKWYNTLMPALMVLSHGLEMPHMMKLNTQEFGDHLQTLSLWLIPPLYASAAFGLFDMANKTHNPITPTYLAVFASSVIIAYAFKYAWTANKTTRNETTKQQIYKAFLAKYTEVKNTVGFSQSYALLKEEIDNTTQLALENPDVLHYREIQKTNLRALRELQTLLAYYKPYDDQHPRVRSLDEYFSQAPGTNVESKLSQADSHTRTFVKFNLAIFTLVLSPALLAQHGGNTGYKGLIMLSAPIAMFMYKILYDQHHMASLIHVNKDENYKDSHDVQVAIRKTHSNVTGFKNGLHSFWQRCTARQQLTQEDNDGLDDSYVSMNEL